MRENVLSREVVDSAYKIHVALGPGLLESVYQAVLSYELRARGFAIREQVGIPVVYGGVSLEIGFIADIFVEELVILELKSVDQVSPVHKKQLQTYLKLSGLRLGLLINFNVELIKNGITRVVNGMPT